MPVTIQYGGSTVLSTQNPPGVTVNVQQPPPSGAPAASYGIGIIEGTAPWGPKGQLVPVSVNNLYATYGQQTGTAHDIVLECIQALSQVKSIYGLRVAVDDVAASVSLDDTTTPTAVVGGTATAFYTGTVGDDITITFADGTVDEAVTATIELPGYLTEVYANIPAPSSSGAFWTNFANAVNNGIAGQSAPSSLIAFTVASSTKPPALGTFSLTGGANGSTPTTDDLLGTDGTGSSRTGAYLIRGSGATAFGIAGFTDDTGWSTLAALCESEGILAVSAVPEGTSWSSGASDLQGANATNDFLKLMTGDSWLAVNDAVLGNISVSPIGLQVGLRCAVTPAGSTLNKPSLGFGNAPFYQTAGYGTTYSSDDIAEIQNSGFDVISNYLQGYLTNTTGVVTSGKQDQYPVLTAYIARNLGIIANRFIGDTQSSSSNDSTRAAAAAAINAFFTTIASYIDGTPSVDLGTDLNTPTTVGSGFLIGSVQVRYLGIVQQFILNYQGGTTVQVVAQSVS